MWDLEQLHSSRPRVDWGGEETLGNGGKVDKVLVFQDEQVQRSNVLNGGSDEQCSLQA